MARRVITIQIAFSRNGSPISSCMAACSDSVRESAFEIANLEVSLVWEREDIKSH